MTSQTNVTSLNAANIAALELFLARHASSSMFLRSNLASAGFTRSPAGLERCQGHYVGAYRDGVLCGVAAHYWNGILILQAPDALGDILPVLCAKSGLEVSGVIGPWDQVREAWKHLGRSAEDCRFVSREILYTLLLERLVRPAPLVSGALKGRVPREDELEKLAVWRADYAAETMKAPRSSELDKEASESLRNRHGLGQLWVVEASGEPVAMTSFNATLPDMVQVGGVYTPPELRGRGYARSAVAHSLEEAHRGGATQGILFTGEENFPAQRAYEALGFELEGAYGLSFFKQPLKPREG